MKSSRLLWTMIGFVSIVSTCIFIFGFGYAIKTVIDPQASKNGISAPPVESDDLVYDDEIHMLAIGDSLTKGAGDQTSKGYIGHVKEALADKTNQPVTLINFAVNGYTTDQLLQDLQTNEAEVRAIERADFILLTIGGNDLFTVGDEVNILNSSAIMGDAIERLDQILTKLVEINPEASIYYVGLYNPFMDFDNHQEISLFVQEWNNAVFKIANRYSNITLVPTYDLFENHGKAYLSSDRFHPNQKGYEQIAERVIQTIE